MSTSAERVLRDERGLRDGARVVLRALPYADPLAQHLVEQVQQEYVVRYGGRDAAVVDAAEFDPPAGLFLVAEVDGVPAGCGAWRAVDGEVAEIKRVYVAPGFRRRGIAQVVVDALERSARGAGHRRMVLNSGDRQPEALALYAGRGYRPVPGYGVYACAPGAVFLGRELAPPVTQAGRADAVPAGSDAPGTIGEEGRPWAW
ncbi:GNAT family N-acetyltransferase [Geodermatophilus sp. YIM 151500]|uniref:GNAT family N-acetyltransferase n=1 Tax=Geodermatophilus sp. YIM 151500 TaxID=2984531 RepID=UPI0021E3E960|nr:GNAT family N-acetyltransferase [Geodermatophilus sp. YIM 151500]MCV2488926.1 GNAT family N-acetyltransferase [Geodermatophilus sp. YIM 151500]